MNRTDEVLIRYCDDFVCCFQNKWEAEAFYGSLIERFKKFGLELAMDKTKILEFGRFAKHNRKMRGDGKPETFDFLGFTFYCSENGNNSFFRCKVKTSRKKFRSKVKAMKEWIKENRTMPIGNLIKKLNQKLRGHYQYYGVTDAREGNLVNEHLRIIEKAIYDKTPLHFQYTNAEQIASTRLVEPLALSYQWYAWYLFAYCVEIKDYRLFKLLRISNCEPTAGTFSKEHGNIELLMKNKSAPDKRKYYHIRLLCKKEIRQQALEYLNSNVIEECNNGDFIITMNAPFERMWFYLLIGFGDKVQVLEPDELKTMLKQKAEEILSIY